MGEDVEVERRKGNRRCSKEELWIWEVRVGRGRAKEEIEGDRRGSEGSDGRGGGR